MDCGAVKEGFSLQIYYYTAFLLPEQVGSCAKYMRTAVLQIDRKFNNIHVKKRQQKFHRFTLDNAFSIPYTLSRNKKRQ